VEVEAPSRPEKTLPKETAVDVEVAGGGTRHDYLWAHWDNLISLGNT